MGITPPTIGQTAWGQPLNDALSGLQDNTIAASDAGFLSWNYSPFQITVANQPTSGSPRMVRLPRFTQQKTVSSIWFHISAAVVTPVAGQCFVALYRIDGTRMGVSADIGAALATPNLQGFNLTGPVVCAAGDYVAAILQNAATPATVGGCTTFSASASNAGLTAATALFTNDPAAQTSFPASITMASRTLSANATWAGVK